MSKVHLSYEDFKATYGDLGLTYWMKFNWLNMDYVGKYNIWDEVSTPDKYISSDGSIGNNPGSLLSTNYFMFYLEKHIT